MRKEGPGPKGGDHKEARGGQWSGEPAQAGGGAAGGERGRCLPGKGVFARPAGTETKNKNKKENLPGRAPGVKSARQEGSGIAERILGPKPGDRSAHLGLASAT